MPRVPVRRRRPRAGQDARLAYDIKEPAPDQEVILTVHELKRLARNATQYNVPAGAVEISTAVDGPTSVLRVTNTGPVVPADLVERLFLPFTRLADRTRHGGFVWA